MSINFYANKLPESFLFNVTLKEIKDFADLHGIWYTHHNDVNNNSNGSYYNFKLDWQFFKDIVKKANTTDNTPKFVSLETFDKYNVFITFPSIGSAIIFPSDDHLRPINPDLLQMSNATKISITFVGIDNKNSLLKESFGQTDYSGTLYLVIFICFIFFIIYLAYQERSSSIGN